MQVHHKILDPTNILAWLKGLDQIKNPLGLFSFIMRIEAKEYWTLPKDSEDFKWVEKLAVAVENYQDKRSLKPQEYPDLLRVLACINCGQAMWMLAQFSAKDPGLIEQLIKSCQNGDLKEIEKEAGVFIGRVKLLARRDAFHRIYSKHNRAFGVEVLTDLKKRGEI